jgi:MFS family permease
MKAITLWGAASAAGGAAGPLVGGVLVDATGWQGLFWIDAGIAAACVPLTILTVAESRDPHRSRSIDWLGTVLIAVVLVPLILALSEGNDWGWASAATLGCFAISIVAIVLFATVEKRVEAPLVDLKLLRNAQLVGATLAILIVAGAINALMYVLSLYFQDPAAFAMSALDAGLATLPAAAVMILVTPVITPLAVKLGPARLIAAGFLLSAAAFGVLAGVSASWTYAAFVVPLVALSIGLAFANGPASSASTSAVSADEVGAASGISNMARYVGSSIAVAAAAMVYNAVTNNHREAGASASDPLAAGLGATALMLAIVCFAGTALVATMRRVHLRKQRGGDRIAAATAVHHTIPLAPASEPKVTVAA